MNQLVIGLLPAKCVRRAVGLLADAFRNDPIFCFHFPDPRLRRKVLELFFGNLVRAHMRFNHVYAAFDGEELVGAAVWRPPGGAVTGLLAQIRGLITRCRLLALSPRIGKMLLRGFAKLETTHPHTPHWHLFFIGIDAERRGHGLGARLMAPVLQAADGDGTSASTEEKRHAVFYAVFNDAFSIMAISALDRTEFLDAHAADHPVFAPGAFRR